MVQGQDGRVELPLDQRPTCSNVAELELGLPEVQQRKKSVPAGIPSQSVGTIKGASQPKVKRARTKSPFTRASSAGLTGKRVVGCLRSVATSFTTPRQAEQRSDPEGPCSWGGLSFGYFSLAKQRKVTRQEGERNPNECEGISLKYQRRTRVSKKPRNQQKALFSVFVRAIQRSPTHRQQMTHRRLQLHRLHRLVQNHMSQFPHLQLEGVAVVGGDQQYRQR